MKNKTASLVLVLISVISTGEVFVQTSTQTYAEADLKISLAEFVNFASRPTNNDKVLAEKVTTMISAAGEAYGWMNVEIKNRNQAQFYCPPGKLSIARDQYVQVLSDYIDKNPNTKTEDFKVWPFYLLKALEETFPC